jgi:hypothetical protein
MGDRSGNSPCPYNENEFSLTAPRRKLVPIPIPDGLLDIEDGLPVFEKQAGGKGVTVRSFDIDELRLAEDRWRYGRLLRLGLDTNAGQQDQES